MTTTGAATLGDLLELADSGTWGDEGSSTNGQLVLRSTNIVDYQIDLSEVAHRTIPAGHIQSKRLEPGDIVVTSSSGSPDHIGKCAVFEPKGVRNPFYFSNFTLRLRTIPSKLDPYYLYHWLKSARGRAILVGQSSTTTGLRNLNKKIYLAQRLPVPPLPEQRRIAALLDRADAVRRKREESRRLVDKLLRSVFLEMFGDPVRNEKGWETLPLGQLAQVRRGASPRPIEHFMGGTVPWIKIGDATSSSSLYIERTAGFVTEEGAERSVLLRPGAIVVANSGVSLGFARILGISGCIHDGWLSVEGLDLRVSPIYFVSLINEMTERLRAMAPAGTQPNLNTTLLKDLLIPLPPPAVQERFSVMVHQVQNLRLSQQNATYQGGNLSTLAWGMLR